MPDFVLTDADAVDWPDVKDPAVWALHHNGVTHRFLLDPDPKLVDADIDIEEEGWQTVVAQQIVETVPPRYELRDSDDDRAPLEGRAAFLRVFEEYIEAVPFRTSHLRLMIDYASERREAAAKAAMRRKSGRPTGRR